MLLLLFCLWNNFWMLSLVLAFFPSNLPKILFVDLSKLFAWFSMLARIARWFWFQLATGRMVTPAIVCARLGQRWYYLFCYSLMDFWLKYDHSIYWEVTAEFTNSPPMPYNHVRRGSCYYILSIGARMGNPALCTPASLEKPTDPPPGWQSTSRI